jgi:hypothetical protein
MRRLAIVTCAAGLVLAAAAPRAAADGGPAPALLGQPVGAPGSSARYLTLPVRHGTLLERIDRRGAAQDWWTIRGRYGVAGAGSDGSTTGLSADGHTLVLPPYTTNYPPRRTRLAVIDPRDPRVVRQITLPGFFTVDAISPAGDWLYLIHYTSSRNLLRYEVRAYDMAHRRLLAKPIVDPREPDEKMVGIAQTRVTSPGGRWDYTLYTRPSGAPFVHALDTADRTARCIDLPTPHLDGPLDLSLGPGGGPLRFVSAGRVEALIDTRTFTLTRPASRPAARRVPPGHTGGGTPVWPAAAIAAGLVAGLAGLRRRRTAYAG